MSYKQRSPKKQHKSQQPLHLRKSPTKAKKSPVRHSSPVKRPVKKHQPHPASPNRNKSPQKHRSPLRTAPARLENNKDLFAVLSDTSISNVLNKLSPENRLKWAQVSPKVRKVYEKDF